MLISFAPVFVKLVDVGPTATGFYRMAVGALVLAVVVAWRRPPMTLDARTLAFGAVAGALFAADIIFWHQSVLDIGPGLSTIIANFQVFILAVFGVVVLRERAGWRLAIAVPLALTGLFLLVGADWAALPGSSRRGILLALLTAVAYGSYLLVLRASQARAARLDPMANLFIICLVASVILAGSAVVSGETLRVPDLRNAGLLAAYGVTAQVLGWVFISNGLPRVEASRAGLVLLSQPALAFVWDVLFFARPTGGRDVAGAALALTAIYLGTRRGT